MTGLSLNLAGGGARGILQAGYIRAIVEAGITPDWVFGTSVGSLNACLYVQGDLYKLYELWNTITDEQVYKFHFWTVSQLLIDRNHIYDSSPLAELIDRTIDFELLQKNGKNFKITATNLTDWATESYGPCELTENEFKTFLLASASPPLAFAPVEFRGKMYGDGGLTNNFNISNAVHAGADKILIVTPTIREDTNLDNVIGIFNILTGIPEYCYLDRELAFIDKINQVQAQFQDLREIKHFILKPQTASAIGLLDFSFKGMDRAEIMQAAYVYARTELENLFNEQQPGDPR